MKCICNEQLGREYEEIIVHLDWCEYSKASKEYKKLHWFKKLFTKKPYKSYVSK